MVCTNQVLCIARKTCWPSTCIQATSPFFFFFPCFPMFDPKSPGSLGFPHLGSSPKHPLINLVPSGNNTSLTSSVSRNPEQWPPLCLKGSAERWEGTLNSSWWVSPLDHGVEFLLGQPWEVSGQGDPFSESVIWVAQPNPHSTKIPAVYKKQFLWRILERVLDQEVHEVFRWVWEHFAGKNFLKGIQIINPYATCLNSAKHFSCCIQVIFLSCFFMHQY